MAKKKPEAETSAPTEAATPTEKPTQREVVRLAIAAGKALPKEGILYIRDTFGMELKNSSFSTLKNQLKNDSGKTPGKRGRKPGQKAVPAPVAARISKPSASPADLVRGLKQLFAEFGAEVVKDTAAALAE